MTEKKPFKERLNEQLFLKYRMVLINESTFEEKISFKLSRINVFILGGIISIVLVAGTSLLIAFTSLKEYIPGYSSLTLKRDAATLIYKMDSLENVLEVNNRYVNTLKNILVGDVSSFTFNKDSVLETVQLDRD